jgi:hypothetical protein
MRPSNIIYGNKAGGHTFGPPHAFIRVGEKKVTKDQAHKGIIETIYSALEAHFDLREVKSGTIDFINWGNMQLVYLVTFKRLTSVERFALLINQPQFPPGRVKAEFDNLQRLAEIDPRFIVRPEKYFSTAEHELFLAPYVHNALCVFADNIHPWGVFNPYPEYHFEVFYDRTKQKTASSMIALLVRYFDQERGKGLAQTHFSGDDFILTQEFDHNDPNTVLPNLRLIAARGWVDVSLEQYLGLLRQEFVVGTHYKDPAVTSGKTLINHKSALPLTLSEIDAGIELGLSLR